MNYSLDQLPGQVTSLVEFVQTELKKLPVEKLNQRPALGGWSLLECLEHLNWYSAYYNSALEKALSGAKSIDPDPQIRLSWIGKKSIEMITPRNTKKHKTIKKMNPQGVLLQATVIDEFLKNQQQLLQLLEKAKSTELGKKTVPVEFFKLLKMNTGETLLFMVLHQQRHFLQLQRILAEISATKSFAA